LKSVRQDPPRKDPCLPYKNVKDIDIVGSEELQHLLKQNFDQFKESNKATEKEIIQKLWSEENMITLLNNQKCKNVMILKDTHATKIGDMNERPDLTGFFSTGSQIPVNIVFHLDHKSCGFKEVDIMKQYTIACTLLTKYQPYRQKYWFFLNNGISILSCLILRMREDEFSISYGDPLPIFDQLENVGDGFRLLWAILNDQNIDETLGFNNPTIQILDLDENNNNYKECPVTLKKVIGSGVHCIALEAEYVNSKNITNSCVVKWYKEV
jgi:hypothetical protein